MRKPVGSNLFFLFKLTSLFFILALGCQCGNTAIAYHLILRNPVSHSKSYVIYKDQDILIELIQLTETNIDDFAEQLGLFTNQKYYRLPELNFYKFKLHNLSRKIITAKLAKSYFTDELQQIYSPLKVKAYNKIYSSRAYSRFDYEYIYSSYILKKQKVNDKKFYKRKYLPNQRTIIKPSEVMQQIIPFKAFSLGSREYKLTLPAISNKKITRDFYFRSLRLE